MAAGMQPGSGKNRASHRDRGRGEDHRLGRGAADRSSAWGPARFISRTRRRKFPSTCPTATPPSAWRLISTGGSRAKSSRDPRTGRERMHYFNPAGGTSIGLDLIGMLRGAPHPELARALMEAPVERGRPEALGFQGRHARRPGEVRAAPITDPVGKGRAGIRAIPLRPLRVSVRGREEFYLSSGMDGGVVQPDPFRGAGDVHRPARRGALGRGEN